MSQFAKNGIITLTRGDTFTFPLSINLGTPLNPNIFILEEGDLLTFRVMRANEEFENADIVKVYTYEDLDVDGNVIIKFTSDDTLWLEPNIYYYDVKLEYTRDEVSHIITFIPRTRFYLVN